MIKVDKDNVTLGGSPTDLMAEYIIITQPLIDAMSEQTGQAVAKSLVRQSFEFVFEEGKKDESRL